MYKKDPTIRPLKQGDKAFLLKWLTTEEVLAFYEGRDRQFTEALIQEKFYADTEEDRWIGEVGGVPIAYLQSYQLTVGDKRTYGYSVYQSVYGMDLFIGEVTYWNKGFGSAFIHLLIARIREKDAAAIVTVDPRVKNVRAIACYKKCGFSIVGKVEKREWHEGSYHDVYIMETKETNGIVT
ncbi:aminoglycoside 6'-N-acetyltransferase [Bacillus sp. JCM 19047]|uniref:GNAT family N-acetyltransferase n=1 Tax=Shouchella miscanthi TaxID=2598861 RepID=A0ABU6NHK0_9BACI|nr:GNAT family N-acetyltransferase [Shouchella miscanthi]MED4127678.1 GNAT family N-acetyltransferase [Shouchella miscanthi]GAF23211.1 aminoglycoside 6'-N-acetyltransferase [Bacillus sp. JCM 19047]